MGFTDATNQPTNQPRLVQDHQIGSGCEEAEEYVRFVAISATPNAMTTREVEEASAQDEELVEVRKAINQCSWSRFRSR